MITSLVSLLDIPHLSIVLHFAVAVSAEVWSQHCQWLNEDGGWLSDRRMDSKMTCKDINMNQSWNIKKAMAYLRVSETRAAI